MTTRVLNVPAHCAAGHVLEPRTTSVDVSFSGGRGSPVRWGCVICVRIEQHQAHYHPNRHPLSAAGQSPERHDVIPEHLLDPASYCVQFSARTLINGPLADWTERVHFEGGRQFADADADRIEARKAREARKRTPTKAKAKPPKAKVEPPTPMLSEARQQAVKERVARRKLDVERSRLDPESANREIAEALARARGGS